MDNYGKPKPTHEAAVDGDALPGPLARGARALEPLRASQVHEVELGGQRLELGHFLGALRILARLQTGE